VAARNGRAERVLPAGREARSLQFAARSGGAGKERQGRLDVVCFRGAWHDGGGSGIGIRGDEGTAMKTEEQGTVRYEATPDPVSTNGRDIDTAIAQLHGEGAEQRVTHADT